MDNSLNKQAEEALRAYLASGVENQVDYQKFYLYSIVTHSTAIEGSTVTEIENQLLFDEGSAAKGRSLTEQMMIYGDDVMLRHHIVNLNCRVREFQESIMRDK